jgi:sigma-B regulation protein RsbU (phosphoserine phosphatase)
VFSKHASSEKISRKLRDVSLKHYLKEISEDRDELKYYEKFCELVKQVQRDADHAIDLEAARALQHRLFEEAPNLMPRFDIAAKTMPCRELSGDYYFIRRLADGRVLIIIADVSGKGIEAALITVLLHGFIRLLLMDNCAFASLITRLNELLYSETEQNKSVTAFIGILEVDDGTLMYWNAGHNDPILIRSDQSITYLKEGGYPLGWFERPAADTVQEHQVQLRGGDILIFYTDGVTEAQDSESNDYGVERLNECVRQAGGGSASSLVENILQKVEDYAQTQADDRTIVVMRAL